MRVARAYVWSQAPTYEVNGRGKFHTLTRLRLQRTGKLQFLSSIVISRKSHTVETQLPLFYVRQALTAEF